MFLRTKISPPFFKYKIDLKDYYKFIKKRLFALFFMVISTKVIKLKGYYSSKSLMKISSKYQLKLLFILRLHPYYFQQFFSRQVLKNELIQLPCPRLVFNLHSNQIRLILAFQQYSSAKISPFYKSNCQYISIDLLPKKKTQSSSLLYQYFSAMPPNWANRLIEHFHSFLNQTRASNIHRLEDVLAQINRYCQHIATTIDIFQELFSAESYQQQTQNEMNLFSLQALFQQICSKIDNHHTKIYQSFQTLFPVMVKLRESIQDQFKLKPIIQSFDSVQQSSLGIFENQNKEVVIFEKQICKQMHGVNSKIYNQLVYQTRKLLKSHKQLLNSFKMKLSEFERYGAISKIVQNMKSVKQIDKDLEELKINRP